MRLASTGGGMRIAGLLFALMLLASGCDFPPLGGGDGPEAEAPPADDPGADDAPPEEDPGADDAPSEDHGGEGHDHSEEPAGGETASEDGSGDAPAPPSGGMNSDLMPEVDETAIPEGAPARRDIDIRQLVDTTPVEFANHGFRIVCDYSHMNFDDPIVFPGQAGASHLHTFFGNTTTDASSDIDSLMAGDTTCIGGRSGNRSSYWVPAMIDTRTNAPVEPSFFIVYYKVPFNTGVDRTTTAPVPNNLRVVAGARDFAATQDVDSVSYSCTTGGSSDGALPDCSGGEMQMSVQFPACWDGENLDSDDHRSHMAYPTNEDNGCPDSHPVMLPTITQNIRYEVPAGTNPRQHWRLSSDMYADSQPGGFSGHGDVFLAWADGVAEWFTENCLHTSASCTVGGEG